MTGPRRPHVFLVLPGALALIAGLWAGLVRLGWPLPATSVPPPGAHGPLMIGGFLGTVIGLERAVALAATTPHRWPFAAPLACALGALVLIAGAPEPLGRALVTLGSAGLVAVFAVIVRLRPDAAHVTMGLGTLAWLAGNLAWLAGGTVAGSVPAWLGFLVLTIAGERLELTQMLARPRGRMRWFAAACAGFLAGIVLAGSVPPWGLRLAGAGAVALGVWLLLHDIARRTVRQTGLTRYIAVCLLAGYFWLVAGGALWVAAAPAFGGGPAYDAMLHAVLVGFVFSMIFGHAPIILPGVAGVKVPFGARFYAPLVLLHASLAARVAGDLAGVAAVRSWGGLLNALAVLLFLAMILATVLAARKRATPSGLPRGA
jgi:hypothetical protein